MAGRRKKRAVSDDLHWTDVSRDRKSSISEASVVSLTEQKPRKKTITPKSRGVSLDSAKSSSKSDVKRELFKTDKVPVVSDQHFSFEMRISRIHLQKKVLQKVESSSDSSDSDSSSSSEEEEEEKARTETTSSDETYEPPKRRSSSSSTKKTPQRRRSESGVKAAKRVRRPSSESSKIAGELKILTS
jgi:hypothetical protein